MWEFGSHCWKREPSNTRNKRVILWIKRCESLFFTKCPHGKWWEKLPFGLNSSSFNITLLRILWVSFHLSTTFNYYDMYEIFSFFYFEFYSKHACQAFVTHLSVLCNLRRAWHVECREATFATQTYNVVRSLNQSPSLTQYKKAAMYFGTYNTKHPIDLYFKALFFLNTHF